MNMFWRGVCTLERTAVEFTRVEGREKKGGRDLTFAVGAEPARCGGRTGEQSPPAQPYVSPRGLQLEWLAQPGNILVHPEVP